MLQQVVNIAKVKHVEVASHVLQDMKDVRKGLSVKVGAFNLSEAITITVSDASWANGQKVV